MESFFPDYLRKANNENAQSTDPLSPDAVEEKVKSELQIELARVPAQLDEMAENTFPFPWSHNASMFTLLGMAVTDLEYGTRRAQIERRMEMMNAKMLEPLSPDDAEKVKAMAAEMFASADTDEVSKFRPTVSC